MKNLTLLPFVFLGVACISFSEPTLAEQPDLKTQLLAQSTQEEPQSPEDFIESLELTEDQKSQIKMIIDEYRPEIRATFQERLAALEVLNNVVNPNSSSNKIRVARYNVVYLHRKLNDLLFEELVAVRDVLTVEQREQINQRIYEVVSASQTTPSSQTTP